MMAPKLRFSRGLKAIAPGAVTCTARVPAPTSGSSTGPAPIDWTQEATMVKVRIFFLPSRVFHRGVRREVLRGVHQIQLGVWGRCEPPSGVRGGAPEDFKINAFQRLITPVSLSFLSQCCYTKIHAIFFIHSHSHHFQLNEVVPNHTLWYQKCQCQWIAQFWVLFFTWTMGPVGVLKFGNSSSLGQGQKMLFTVISTGTLCQSDGREYSLY